MIDVKSTTSVCVFALIVTEVTSWTIDLPEVRKFYFERNARKHGDKNKIYFSRQPELVNYNNIEGNSFHNTPRLHTGVNGGELDGNGNYADDYKYYTYMEKKVHNIVHKGAIYLEGLRRAMERYSEQLENCSKLERSRQPTNRTNWAPESELEPRPLNSSEVARLACEKVSRDSEHVRRLSSLVVWAIRELQDISYAKDYDKHTKESEEDVLLLQLAWALDELARLTGYEPDPTQFATYPTPAPAPSTTPLTYFNLPIPNDGPTKSNCIKDTSAPGVPATVRCAAPVPDALLQFLNMSNASIALVSSQPLVRDIMRRLSMFNNSGSGQGQQTFNNMTPEEVRQQMLNCFTDNPTNVDVCRGFQGFLQFLNSYSQQQTPQTFNLQSRPNRETDSSQLEILEAAEDHSVLPLLNFRRKRTTDPLQEFANFYVKYMTWTNSNPAEGSTKSDYDVKNELTPAKTIRKRSVYVKENARISEDPMQDLSYYVRHKPGVRYIKDSIQAEKIKAYLDKMFHSNGLTVKEHVRKLDKMIKSVHKRSVHYQKLHRPRVPEDPMQDISYYVKNKPGTNIRPNLAHALRVRVGLQEIFERGNIVVIRQYGSNYIPGVRPLTVGALESFTDF